MDCDALNLFHPAVAAWFRGTFAAPSPAQRAAWPAIKAGNHTLIAAPTGSGKTLAAFLCAIDELVRDAAAGSLADATRVVYVSPLKALSNDIERNLQAPLQGVRALLPTGAAGAAEIRAGLRTGDTPPAARTAMTKRPPHIVVTTPESLYLLLTSAGGRGMLATTRTVNRRRDPCRPRLQARRPSGPESGAPGCPHRRTGDPHRSLSPRSAPSPRRPPS